MSNIDVNDLVSILKFLDESYLSEDQCFEICNLNMDDVESQKIIARKILVPGINEMNHQTQKHLIDSLRQIIDTGMDCSSTFERVNAPFDLSDINHIGFLEVVYEEVGRKR